MRTPGIRTPVVEEAIAAVEALVDKLREGLSPEEHAAFAEAFARRAQVESCLVEP